MSRRISLPIEGATEAECGPCRWRHGVQIGTRPQYACHFGTLDKTRGGTLRRDECITAEREHAAMERDARLGAIAREMMGEVGDDYSRGAVCDALEEAMENEAAALRAGGEAVNWCWYIEGGSFLSGFETRQDAVNSAHADGHDRRSVYVGLTECPGDVIARFVSAADIAENVGENMNMEDVYVRALPGAQAALEAWAHEWMECDAHEVCVNGEHPTEDEWQEATRRAEEEVK